jgi:hypothetical protein
MGNGLEKKPLFPGLESPAIAHNESPEAQRRRASGLMMSHLRENRLVCGAEIYSCRK